MADDWDPFADPAEAEPVPVPEKPAERKKEVAAAVPVVEKHAGQERQERAVASGPPRYCVTGSWNNWRPLDMTWDPERQVFYLKVCLGAEGQESFQILVNGQFHRCIHPDCMDACPHEAYNLCGPDDEGNDFHWTIGKHSEDRGEPGAIYEIRFVVLSSTGTPLVVDWEKLADGPPVAKAAPAASAPLRESPQEPKEQRSVSSWLKGSRSGPRPYGYQGGSSSKDSAKDSVPDARDTGAGSVAKRPSETRSAAQNSGSDELEPQGRLPGQLSLEWVEKPPNLQIMGDGWVLLEGELDDVVREQVQRELAGDVGICPSTGSGSYPQNRFRQSSAITPVCHLGECGSLSCSLCRSVNAQARPEFLDMVINRIVASPIMSEDLVYASLGSGELLFDFMLLEALKALDISIGQVHLVDPLYEPRVCRGLASSRLALAQFTRWFPEAMVYAHPSVEELTVRCKRSQIELHIVSVVDCIELTGRWDEDLQPAMEELLAYDGLLFMLTGASGHSRRGSGGSRNPIAGFSAGAAQGEAWQLDKASGRLKMLEKQKWIPRHDVLCEEREFPQDDNWL